MNPPDAEMIVLVTESGAPIGAAPKLSSHHQNTPLHLAFSTYMFDQHGNFLLTRRAPSKKTWPGVWTNTCCGHPMPNEPLENAVDRRLRAELGTGAKRLDVIIAAGRYRAVMGNGVVENEIGPVLRVTASETVTPNPTEICEAKWLPWAEVVESVESGRLEISPWAKLTIAELAALGPDPWQWPPLHEAQHLPALPLTRANGNIVEGSA